MNLESLATPALLLDRKRVEQNAARMGQRISQLGANLRPHVKTHKCAEIGRLQTVGHSGAITVSTLAEARGFAAKGFADITYAVPIEVGKFGPAIELSRNCESLNLLTDDGETAALLNNAARQAGVKLNVFLKVDCGYHRCGVAPESAEALSIPRQISESSNLRFAGILTHAGHSYHCQTTKERLEVARQEREVMLDVATRLRSNWVEVPVVSIGSTPSITAVDHLDGIDEARPGNYIFFDAFQAAIATCELKDCALTTLAAVVHRDPKRGKIVIDAGAIALSKDRGAVEFKPNCGYGRVLDLEGTDLGLQLESLSQEHGEVSGVGEGLMERLKVGARVRILANHSCLTAAQYSHYDVLDGDQVVDEWEILRGW